MSPEGWEVGAGAGGRLGMRGSPREMIARGGRGLVHQARERWWGCRYCIGVERYVASSICRVLDRLEMIV
jgi:hypothetical protein